MDQEKVVDFHNLVANILYSNNRARSDTWTAISFLRTRVGDTNEGDWYKLVHLMQYIIGIRKILLTLSAFLNGGWMHLFKYILICDKIQEEAYL